MQVLFQFAGTRTRDHPFFILAVQSWFVQFGMCQSHLFQLSSTCSRNSWKRERTRSRPSFPGLRRRERLVFGDDKPLAESRTARGGSAPAQDGDAAEVPTAPLAPGGLDTRLRSEGVSPALVARHFQTLSNSAGPTRRRRSTSRWITPGASRPPRRLPSARRGSCAAPSRIGSCRPAAGRRDQGV